MFLARRRRSTESCARQESASANSCRTKIPEGSRFRGCGVAIHRRRLRTTLRTKILPLARTLRDVNRLAGATSPYLLQHAENPVDWYPWGDEAFERALAEDKPLLVSVGYSSCHWCHVMAHESFENAATAAVDERASSST